MFSIQATQKLEEVLRDLEEFLKELQKQQEQTAPAKSHPFPAKFAAKFASTEYLVEATSFEMQTLWERFNKLTTWDQISVGCLVQIGELDNRPITLSCIWQIIGSHHILFWECVSQVSDLVQINNWFAEYCLPKTKNGRQAVTNAQNFHVVFQHLDIKLINPSL